MNRSIRKIMALFLAVLLAAGSFGVRARAAETDDSFVTEGVYAYTTGGGKDLQEQDRFVFREDCFMRSSFLGCAHLAELSAQAAMASSGLTGAGSDPADSADNLTAFLNAAGFEDVETNRYYALATQENSIGVAVARRTVKAFGHRYTLLAVIPRSAGYKQEWAGNFTVGGGVMHEGYKAARDEVLRFMKQYLEKHDIGGELKIWTAGHSRGGAVANLLGGFLAGGGVSYFGGLVSLAPEDVYCYTYAAPRAVKAQPDRRAELSVAGARSGAAYAADTPGEAYTADASSTADLSSEIYGGIRNYIFDEDAIPKLPPAGWGFGHYGTDLAAGQDAAEEDVLAALQAFGKNAYKAFTEGGDYRTFAWYTFDLTSLELVPDKAAHSARTMGEFMESRVPGLTAGCASNALYVSEGYQETMVHAAGLAGLLLGLPSDSVQAEAADFVRPAVLLVLSYAAERMQEERGAQDETEGVTMALEDVLAWLSGRDIRHESFTVDDFLEVLAVWLTEHETDPLGTAAFDALTGAIPEKAAGIVSSFLGGFHKDNSVFSPVSAADAIRAYIRACANGPDPDCSMAKSCPTAKDARSILYTVGPLVLAFTDLEIGDILKDKGTHPFGEAVETFLPLLLKATDEAGNETVYNSVTEAADAALTEALDSVIGPLAEKAGAVFGSAYRADILRHLEALKEGIGRLRKTAAYALFYTEGEPFSTAQALANACTLACNAKIIPSAHYNEGYIARMRAEAEAGTEAEHGITHDAGRPADYEQDGVREHWILREGGEKRYFADCFLKEELTEADLVIPRETEADPQPPVTTVNPGSSAEAESTPAESARPETEPSGIPPETAPDEGGTGQGGETVLWVAAGLLAAGGCLAGLLVWKKKSEGGGKG
ncbi:MAG: hypothetical protein J5493_02465 [Lachnospiraceae bacterium]|nr:hypothetical protein [Lachnospiraceae bacterium]